MTSRGAICRKMCLCESQLAGKVALITGGNAGIGLETARDFVKRGATVVLAGRDQGRLEGAVADIKTSDGSGTLDILLLDLGNFASVRSAAEKFQAKYKELHILVNNAGIMAVPHKLTVDGNESQFQTNHLSHFLFTHLLLDLLKKSAPSRVINLSSRAHTTVYPGGIAFDDLTGERNYSDWKAYGSSKLSNILFSAELAKVLSRTGVTVSAVHPGVINSNLYSGMTGCFGGLARLMKPMFLTVQEGAQTTIHCSVCLELADESTSGRYYASCAALQPSAYARDPALAKKLWDVSMSICQLNK